MTAWAEGIKTTPFRHEAAPPEQPDGSQASGEAEVVIVGAGVIPTSRS